MPVKLGDVQLVKTERVGQTRVIVDGKDLSRMTESVKVFLKAGERPVVILRLIPDHVDLVETADVIEEKG